MSRRRPTEVSWDSDDDLLKDQPSVSAFPDKTRGDLDDIDDIDINALLGYEEDDDLMSEKSTSLTKKTPAVQEKPKKTIPNTVTKKTTATVTTKARTASAKSNSSMSSSSSTKVMTGKEKVSPKPNSEKSDAMNKKPTVVKQNSGKKTIPTKVSSSSANGVKADNKPKPKKKIEPIVFDLPDVEQPAEDLIVLDAEETLDFEYDGEEHVSESILDTTSSQSQYNTQIETVTLEEVSEQDISVQDSMLNDEESAYPAQESSEESDSDGEDSRRGRFKSERKNVITIKTIKKEKGSIPDTLEISQEQQAELDEFYHHGKGGRQRGRGRGGMAGRLGPRPGLQRQQRNPQQVHMAATPIQHLQPQNQQNQHPYPQGQSLPDFKPRNIHINPRFRPPNPQVNTSVPLPPHELVPQQSAPHPTYSDANVQQAPQPQMMQPVRMPVQMAPPHPQVERWPPPTSQPQPMPLFPGNRPPVQGQYLPNSQPYPVHNHPPSSGPMMVSQAGPPPQQHHYNQMQAPAPQPGPYFQNGPPGQRGPQPLLQVPQRPPMMQHGGRPPFQGVPPQQQFIPPNNQYNRAPQPLIGRPAAPPHQHPQPLMGQHPGGQHPRGQHPGVQHPGGQHPGGQFRGPGQHQFQQPPPQQQQHIQQHPQQRGQPPQRFQHHPQPQAIHGMGPQFQHPGALGQPRHGNQQNPPHQRPGLQPRLGQPQRSQRPRLDLSEAQKAARLAHTKKLQERARKFQMNKIQQNQGQIQQNQGQIQQNQGQPIQVVGGWTRKRPSVEGGGEPTPVKQAKEEPKPLQTETIEVDPDTKRRLEEQARLREKIRKQKELNRQRAAEVRKKELEERLAKEGKTLDDIKTAPPTVNQPQTGQLQPGPIRNAGQNLQGQGHLQVSFKKVQQSASFPNKASQQQNVPVKQQGVKRTMTAVQSQSSRPNSAVSQDGPTGGKIMKKVTIVKRNKNGDIISSETKIVPMHEDVTKKSSGQIPAKGQSSSTGGQKPSVQTAAKGQSVSTGGQSSKPGVQNAGANKKIVLKPNVGTNPGNKIVLKKGTGNNTGFNQPYGNRTGSNQPYGNRAGYNQPSPINRSVVLKGQGQGIRPQGVQNMRKVVSHQGMGDQAGRRVVMSGDAKPRMVLIKNLSTSTSEASVHHICSVVGPVETILLNQVMKQAKVTFINSLHAEMFQKKYNRRMVDLSHITVDLLTT